ncbi:MAG: ribbon-helix-helix domain-containing protein [Proteobacteria bacterium]|nr:ribbon-helix-helix domain-containing protein [Pseudomonadota bacterium]MBU4010664.1 ribbon-helix-helix domain-containing protein [Pseudomonadota bacterium]
MNTDRKSYNTTLRTDLIKKLKILSAETDKRQNDLIEEAIEDILNKYYKQQPEKTT